MGKLSHETGRQATNRTHPLVAAVGDVVSWCEGGLMTAMLALAMCGMPRYAMAGRQAGRKPHPPRQSAKDPTKPSSSFFAGLRATQQFCVSRFSWSPYHMVERNACVRGACTCYVLANVLHGTTLTRPFAPRVLIPPLFAFNCPEESFAFHRNRFGIASS